MAKLSELKGSDLVVVEIPAILGIDQKSKTTFEKIAAKRSVITKQGFTFFKADDESTPILVGTPNGEIDEENPTLIGFIAFDKETKEVKKEVVETPLEQDTENKSDPRGVRQ